MGTKRSIAECSGSKSLLSNVLSSSSKTTKSALSSHNILHPSDSSTGSKLKLKEEYSVAPDQAIADYLDSMRAMIEQRGSGGNIEVEVRLGRIVSKLQQNLRFSGMYPGMDAAIALSEDKMREHNAKFEVGVSHEAFDAYKKSMLFLAEGDKFTKQEEKQVVYSFAGSKRVIEQVDPYTNEKEKPELQVKEKLGCFNIFLPNCPYDVRVAISCEFPHQALPNGLNDFPSPESERHKDRISVVGKDLRIDMTTVHDGISDLASYEMELELKNNVMQDWLTAPDESQAAKIASEQSSQIWNMVKLLMPPAGQAFKKKWGFPGTQEVKSAYRHLVSDLWSSDKFPGTMPVGFARWHIPHIKSRKYWVSEKTDGVRYFLVVAGGTAALIDRTNAPFSTSGLELLSMIFPSGTVLDGEFVLHQKERRYTFMVFDVLSTGSFPKDNHVKKPFEQRLQILNDFLSEEGPYATALRGRVNSTSVIPVVRKKWLPVQQIVSVFKLITRVQMKDKSIARVYSDNRRTHFTDGIVFCPNSTYTCGRHNEYLKWKWSDLITIDFLSVVNDENPSDILLSCGGPRNTNIDINGLIAIDPKDKKTILHILNKLPSRKAVLEYGFCIESGLWNYKCHRPDKDNANYVATVLGSLLNIAEAISEEELQYRLMHSSPQSDWNDQTKRMRRGILHHLLHK